MHTSHTMFYSTVIQHLHWNKTFSFLLKGTMEIDVPVQFPNREMNWTESNQRPAGKDISFSSYAHQSARVTGAQGSSSRASHQLPRHSLSASGGILVQVGLSMYIPAPSCHAGDYDEEGRSGGSCCMLKFAGCWWKVWWADLAGRRGWWRHKRASVLVGMLPARSVQLASNWRALRAASLLGW